MRRPRSAGIAIAATPLLLGVAFAVAGCGADGDDEEATVPRVPQSIRLESPLFRDGGELPVEVTCDGEGVSPPLRWSGAPDRTRELALLVRDPDAPGGTFTHWVVYGIDRKLDRIEQGSVPRGAVQGENSDGQDDYFPPCPPEGDPAHRYEFTLYSSEPLGLEPGASVDEVLAALAEGVLARGTLTGTYSR